MPATGAGRKVVPAQLGFLAIYNPSLGATDETIENQIVYYSNNRRRTGDSNKARKPSSKNPEEDGIREERNEQLRQIGLAQGMVEFGRSFSDGAAVGTVETEKSRIILHELEAGWWILASINLTILPGITKVPATKGKPAEEQETVEYSSREVKPPILLLGDLLRAHSTFLLHHAFSMSALFVRTRRSKFTSILGRYWDTFVSSWNVLMHGNPANSLYGGIKIAACGELGMGVGEEDRGSAEREVLEGFVGRIEGLVDVIVSKFGDGESTLDVKRKDSSPAKPSQPWLGSGDEPAAEDGAVFLGTGALSRKSLRDVTHWVEDLYSWGEYAYGVIDNPSSTRRQKKSKGNLPVRSKKESTRSASQKKGQNHSPSVLPDPLDDHIPHEAMTTLPPAPILEGHAARSLISNSRRPSFKRGPGSTASTESESGKSNKFMQYLKLGYGTHWSIAGTSSKNQAEQDRTDATEPQIKIDLDVRSEGLDDTPDNPPSHYDDSVGHYLIGLKDDFKDEDEQLDEDSQDPETEEYNSRLLIRTLTVELERKEDARAEADISIDLRSTDLEATSMHANSEHTVTSNASFETQDRNKTKKLRVIVYVKRPFIFVFLFELQTEALALASLYRSLHQQIKPLLKPLVNSTTYRASKPELNSGDDSISPIFDLVWDPRSLTIYSTIPNIPNPFQQSLSEPGSWSRIEALNTHMQIVNTYLAGSADRSELERTCKTSRGWWVVWTRVPDPNPPTIPVNSGKVSVSGHIAEDGMESRTSEDIRGLQLTSTPSKSHGTSTFGGSSMVSGPAHPYLEAMLVPSEAAPKDKEIFLIRRASDYVTKSGSRFASGASAMVPETGWTSAPAKLAQGIGVDTKRYIDALLNLNR